MTTRINRQWCLAARPKGHFQVSDFTWKEAELRDLQAGEILVRTLYLSLDPTNRGWANASDGYLPAVAIGDVMRGVGIGVVADSRNEDFSVGQIVQGMTGWQLYNIFKGHQITPLPWDGSTPLTAFMGLFGHIGITAYFGLLDITAPKSGETLVVSAAAGAVGSLVGQIGKIQGCRVVGIAGTDEKCTWLTEELGFDAAINYKTSSVPKMLREHCPEGIDIYFDNVGGDILDAVLAQINIGARISLCGLISQYNATEPVPGPYNFGNLIIKRAKIEGFIVLDYNDRAAEAMAALGTWLREGKIKYRVDVVKGLEHAPEAVNRLFSGANKGKLIVEVSSLAG